MSKIAVITDMDMKGSGYFYLMTPLLTGLAEMGHEIKVSGLSYLGEEHRFPFSIIPCKDLQDTLAVSNNLVYTWGVDIFLVAMDIPIQIPVFASLQPLQKPYIAITPLENGPLTMSWAAGLFNINHIFFISEMGRQAAIKSGLFKADHLFVGIDTESFRPPQPEERQKIRDTLGIGKDDYVILSVADNQERKNLSAAFEIISKVKKETERPIRYILVTREQSPFGWKLRDLSVVLDINKELNIYERGMPRENLWGLYAASDLYLNTSKAEGLGLPVLDAMSVGIPVVATDTGALHELLEDDRGFLIPPAFTITDVWGNSLRNFIDVELAKNVIVELMTHDTDVHQNALRYVQTRTWDIPCKQLDDVIRKLTNEPKAQ